MKKLFISMLAVAALASCSNEQTLELNPGEAISFGGPFVENSTRAAVDPSYGGGVNSFTEFQVWGTVGGVPIYAGEDVTGTVGEVLVDGKETNVWTCESVKQYWIKDAQYKFAALANAGTVTLGDDKLPQSTTFDATDANVDLIYAEPVARVGVASGNAPVEFTFAHLLSKVKFTVNNNSTAATGYSFVVKDIKVNGFKAGVVNLANGNWDFTGKTKADYGVANIVVATGKANEENAQELLLIPGAFDITFKVDILSNGTTIATHSYPATGNAYSVSLAGGHAYNFQINVAVGEEITFSVDENPEWTVVTPATTLN